MSANTIHRPSQGTRPLMVLAALLENAHHRDDKIVSFPANTSDAIIQARPRGTQYAMQEVQAIVLALESRESTVCERLDSLGLIILCSIFMYSQECLAQQRGLCLLARVLHRTERNTAQEIAQKKENKIAIGRVALTLLIKGFFKTDASEKLRRWLGILSLELLKDCPENVEKLRSDPFEERHWRYLGDVIEHGSCQVLKLLAGSMIRELLSSGVMPDDFWQSETRSDLFSKFPKGQYHNSQWVTSFEEYVDELVLQKILTQQVSSVLFAYAVYVGDREWNLKQALDILVTVSEELTIVIPANGVNPAVYIDVLLDTISEVSFDNAHILDSQQPSYGAVIRFDGGGTSTTNCILNATGSVEHHLALAFSSQKDANTLKRLLMPRDFRTHALAPHRRSGTTDASEQILSDDELAAPDLATNHDQMLMGKASLGNAFDSHGDAVRTINPSMLERFHPSQRTLTEHQGISSNMEFVDDKDRLIVSHRVDMAVEGIDVSQNDDIWIEQAIEGIDVSQIDGSSHDKIQCRDNQTMIPANVLPYAPLQNHQALENRKHTCIGRLDQVPDQERLSSSPLNTDLQSTENIPPFQAQPPQQAVSSVEQVENKRGADGQNREHDDLYFANSKPMMGHRRSPRILEKDNSPQNLERPLETTVRQASARNGPPIKLSRQLRNSDGFVELHKEQTADDGLTASVKNDAVDINTSANRKRNRPPAPGKAKKGTKDLTEHSKKPAQSRGKKVATEESRGKHLDEYDLPPSPKRVGSSIKSSRDKEKATSTQLKATKAPRDNRKKAKSVPTKAPTAASSKRSAPQLSDGLKSEAEASGPLQDSLPNGTSGKNVDDDDDAPWDVDHAHGVEEPQSLRLSRQPLKPAKKHDVPTPKPEKNRIQAQLLLDTAKANKPPIAKNRQSVGRHVGAKPAPAILSRARPRRAAAIKANKKIQGLDESEEIVDDEELARAPTRSKTHTPLVAAKTSEDQEVKYGGDNRRVKLPTNKSPTKDFIPDSISPDSSDKQRRDSVLDRKANSSGEKVNLIKDASVKALRAAAGNKGKILQRENPTSAADASAIPIHAGRDDHSNRLGRISAQQNAESSEAGFFMVSNSIMKLREPIAETEPAHISFKPHRNAKQGYPDLHATSGPGDQDQIECVMPCTGDGSLEVNLTLDRTEGKGARPQAPTAPMTVSIREKRTSPRLAGSAGKSLLKPTSTRRELFASKLNASMPQEKDTNRQVKSSKVSTDTGLESKEPNTSRSDRSERPSREPQTKALITPGAASGKGQQYESTGKFLRSSKQVDGEGNSLIIQSLRPAGEKTSASGLEMKRKTEQKGDSSNKRVKVMPNERLEAARRKPGLDADKKTPPVVSNKPLVIGFCPSGPRNQGTISTKKSKAPEDVRHDAVDLRKHEALKTMIDQVDVDFTSAQQPLETTSEDVQHSVKVPSVVQKKDHDSAQQKLADSHEALNAVAQTKENGAEKRKLVPFFEDHAVLEHEQLFKRQKRNMRTPPNAQKYHPKMLPDFGPASIRDRSQRLGSQNTRVNENGSPMPFFVDRNESKKAEDHYSDDDDGKDALAEARLEEPFAVQGDDMVLLEPFLPHPRLVSGVSASQKQARAYQSLSNNSKQVPSSPHASSAFGTMPPHHLYHDGEIVNAETKEPIVPSKPQDPFLDSFFGGTQKPPNTFMDALRRSTEFAAKSLISGASDKRTAGGVVIRQDHNGGEDPDKTLVEPKLRKRHKPIHVSDSSSSSQSSSSTQASQPDEPPSEDSETEIEAEWRKGLEPHQENMLDCLLTISHRLIRHLVDKETAIKDMVSDFANHSHSLVNGYEKALQERTDSHTAYNDRKRQELVKIFEKAQADVATTSKAVAKRHVKNMQAQWKTHQEALMGKVTAALEACE